MDAEMLSISLPNDMMQMVRRQVASGAYPSASAVVHDALHLLQQRDQERTDRLASIRTRLSEAADSSERFSDDQITRYFDSRLAEAESKRAP